jgi:predicted  nucleic acid-binding Zn-ribbon protein
MISDDRWVKCTFKKDFEGDLIFRTIGQFAMSDSETSARSWDDLRRARKEVIERLNEAWDQIHDFEFELRELERRRPRLDENLRSVQDELAALEDEAWRRFKLCL